MYDSWRPCRKCGTEAYVSGEDIWDNSYRPLCRRCIDVIRFLDAWQEHFRSKRRKAQYEFSLWLNAYVRAKPPACEDDGDEYYDEWRFWNLQNEDEMCPPLIKRSKFA